MSDGAEPTAGVPASGESRSERLRSFSTSRPVAILMVFLAAVVFGSFSYRRLPITLMPELSYPTLTVRTEYPGSAPEEVENDISRPIEEALGVIGGLSRISSISRAGVSDVVLEFSWDVDMSEALQDTLEKLDLVFLPEAAERPLILRFDPSLDPVLELSLSGSVTGSAGERFRQEEGLRTVRRIAELQVRRALEPIKGVAAVRLRGGLEEEIHVLVDDDRLRRTGLSIQRVIDRLRQENVNVAGGTIKEGRIEYMVRTLNEYQNLSQIADTVIASVGGRDVRIRDVATVVMAHKEREIRTRTNGGESVQIDIFKEADANMVALSKAVRERLGEFDVEQYEKELREGPEKQADVGKKGPPGRGGRGMPGRGAPEEGLKAQLYKNEGVLVDVVADRSIFIESSIDEVRNTAILGGFLAIAVLFLFLRNFKSTAIIAVSIPISLMVTFAPLNLLGVTLNIMSLGGLALGIGMLVDSSIVVLESIFRCREEGDGVVGAAVRGTGEVRGAVVASTFTTIAVFFPMVFVEGVAGQAFGDLGLAVVISLLASVVVAVSFIPMLASRGGLKLGTDAAGAELWRLRTPKALAEDFRAATAWVRQSRFLRAVPWLSFVVYLVLRFVLTFVFELFGHLLLSLLFLLAFIGLRVLWPVIGPVFRGLTSVPLRLV
ncbi:MAG: efflux RND transporter permease subunit, partial [Thermoanaerobaculia bacterium]